MNDQLNNLIRWDIRRKLIHCSNEQQATFTEMYAPDHAVSNLDDAVDGVADYQLPMASAKVDATLEASGVVVESIDLVKFLEAFEKEKAAAVLVCQSTSDGGGLKCGAEVLLRVLKKIENAAKET